MDFTKQIEKVNEAAKELKDAFLEIQQPRTDFVLKYFVVGEYETPERQYMQCVEELRRAYQSIKGAMLERKKLELEIQLLRKKQNELPVRVKYSAVDDDFIADQDGIAREFADIEIEQKQLTLEDLDAGILGKLREFDCLYAIFKKLGTFTHEQLEQAEAEYWRIRLCRQAAEDLAAHGRIGVGNMDAMRQIGMITPPTLRIKREKVSEDPMSPEVDKVYDDVEFNIDAVRNIRHDLVKQLVPKYNGAKLTPPCTGIHEGDD